MGKVEDENYYTIQGWMINKLNLKGNELSVYAIIYGFTQLEGQRFTQSLQYLADWVNGTKQGVEKNLQNLIDKGLIIKEQLYNSVAYYTTQLQEIEKEKKEEKTKKSWIKENKDNKEIVKDKEHDILKEIDIINYIIKKNFDEPKIDEVDNSKNETQQLSQLSTSTIKCQSGTLSQNITKSTEETQPVKYNRKNFIYIELDLVLDSIRSLYSKFGYGKRFLRKATGTKIVRLVNKLPDKDRLNPTQIVLAYNQYLAECYRDKKDFNYVKASSNFLTDMVYAYVDVIKYVAEDKLEEKYGENWKELKFRIKEES